MTIRRSITGLVTISEGTVCVRITAIKRAVSRVPTLFNVQAYIAEFLDSKEILSRNIPDNWTKVLKKKIEMLSRL